MSKQSHAANSGRRLLVIIFLAAAGLLAGSMAVTFYIGHLALDAQRQMSIQFGVLNQLPELASTIKDAETGQRGYLLTGEDAYLQPYDSSLKQLKSELDALQKLAAAGHISADDLSHTS